MQKKLIAIALVAAFAAPAFAEDAAPAAPYTLTGNMTIATDYRFRGISQTFGQPAIQGGIDFSHESGIYVGNWNSNVSQYTGYPNGNLEMDFYGGWKKSFGDFGIDVGGLYYYYPGTDNKFNSGLNAKHPNAEAHGGKTDNFEVYLAGSWKFLTLKYSHATTDYFGMPKTRGSNYWDLSGNYDLGDGWGINGHVGHLQMKSFEYNPTGLVANTKGNYTDWKVGVTKDLSGWVVGLAYVGTNAKDKGDCNAGTAEFYHYCKPQADGSLKGIKAGSNTLVASITKNF